MPSRAAALALLLAGCSGDEFPQYSGSYRLSNVAYSDPSFAGALRLPEELLISHRMRYEGCCFNHYLKLDFVPAENSAVGAVGGALTSLTYQDDNAWPNEWFDGITLAEVDGPNLGPWCRVKYVYTVYLSSTPDAAILARVYRGHDEVIEGANGEALEVGLNDPSEAPIDEAARDEWLSALDDNGAISIRLELRRNLWSSTSMCGELNPYDLVPPDKRAASLVAVYSQDADAAEDQQSYDLRATPYAPGQFAPLVPMSSFFGQVVTW